LQGITNPNGIDTLDTKEQNWYGQNDEDLTIALFYFSKDILSSVFQKKENKVNRKRNAKAMKLFMKYSS